MNLNGHTKYVNLVCLSPNGKVLASGSYDHTIKLWNTESRNQIPTLLYANF